MRFFSEEVRERLHRRLDEAFGALKDSGAEVTIQLGTGYLPVINDERVTEWVRAAAIDLVGEDNVFLQYDIYHMQIMEGYLAETLKANLDIISHIQIAGVPGRHEPDGHQEVNYPYLFDLLDDVGYDGWVACEYRPRGTTLAGLEWARRYGIDPGKG